MSQENLEIVREAWAAFVERGAATAGGAGSLSVGCIGGLARAVIDRRPDWQRRADSGVIANEAFELLVELGGGLVLILISVLIAVATTP